MTREEILSGVERFQPWFHRIDLGGGIYTKTSSMMGEPIDYPREQWEKIQELLPLNLSGKTLLDVGCNAGFFAFEAKRRGAKRVLGIDGQRQHVRQGLFVRKVLGLDVEFRRMNVYELTPRAVGQFDITLALGLLYHLKHPVMALENLYQVTKELLVIETAIMPPVFTPESFGYSFGGPSWTKLHPLAYVENSANAKEQIANWFLPGISALTALLKNTGFAEVEVAEVKNDRAVVVCRKVQGEAGADHNLNQFNALLKLESGPQSCQAPSELTFQVRVENISATRWSAGRKKLVNKGEVYLGVHLLRDTEEEVDWDYGAAFLSLDLEPGDSEIVEVEVTAPETAGSYILEFDMVAEHVTWFEDHGSGTLRHLLVVE